jgi:hypothetical protein
VTSPFEINQSLILRLPIELHLIIIEHLDFPTTQLLGMANRYFHGLISTPTLPELLAFEKDPDAHEHDVRPFLRTIWRDVVMGPWRFMWVGELACSYCVRLRPRWEFADNQRNCGEKRFCIDCGLSAKRGRRRYYPGDELIISKEKFVWCKCCDMFTSEVGPMNSGCCADCFTREYAFKKLVPLIKRKKNGRWSGRGMYGKKGEGVEAIEGRVGLLEKYYEDYDDYFENFEDTGYWDHCELVD